MRISLIKCPWWVRYCPPYILAFFATLLKQRGHSAKVFDLNNILYHRAPKEYKKFWDDRDYYSLWENPSYIYSLMALTDSEEAREEILADSPDVVCFTTHTPNTLFSEKMAQGIKRKNKKIIIVFMGHKCSRAQMAYDFVSRDYIDYVCTGESDVALCELLEKLKKRKNGNLPACRGFLMKKKGKIVDGGSPPIVKNLDALPFPEYGDFTQEINEDSYSQPNRLDILDSRGCINSCHFCYERLYWQKFRTLSAGRIYEQISHHIKNYPKINYFYFNGLLLNGDLKVLNRFCELIIKNKTKIKWSGQAMIRAEMNSELLMKMKKAGCDWLYYGVESGSDKVLREMNKNCNISKSFKVLKETHKAGIKVQINIMFGFPTETREDFNRTLEFLIRARPYIDTVLASQSFCTLEKETCLWKHPEKFGIVGEKHHLFWKSQNGENNYRERFRRYEEFCRIALKLGIPETSGVLSQKPDKWFLLGMSYKHEGNYAQAVECFERSLQEETDNSTLRAMLTSCKNKL